MYTRRLGAMNLESSAIGLGSAALAGSYGPASAAGSIRAIRFAFDIGITMFDAVGDYRRREETEDLLGSALLSHRDSVLLAIQAGAHAENGRIVQIGVEGHLALACDDSLRRLRTDYIDILYLPRQLPFPLTAGIGVLTDLVAAGKIRHIGLCEPSIDELRCAHAIHPISVLAVEYSLQRIPEQGLLTAARELGVGIVACHPLAGGLLAGKTSLVPSRLGMAVLRAFEAEAASLNLGTARLALAWLLSCQDNVVPLPSSRSVTHVEMNASATAVPLPVGTCERLAQLFTALRP